MPQPEPEDTAAAETTVAKEPAIPAPAEAHAPAERARDLMLSAFRLREAGDLDGALDAASQVVALQPENVGAHALLSTLHEHKGNLDAAIAEREIVLKLAPDSDADREKLEMLKKGIRQAAPRRIISPKPLGTPVLFEKRPSPAVIAVIAFLLVAIVGSASVLLRHRPGEKQAPVQVAQNAPPAATGPQTYSQSAFTAPPSQSAPQPNQQQAAAPSAGMQQPQYEQPDQQRRRMSNSFTGMEDNRYVPPAQVAIPDNGGLERDNRSARQTAEPDPSAFHLPDRSTDYNMNGANPPAQQPPMQQAPAQQSPPRDPGHIEIILAPDPSGASHSSAKPPANSAGGSPSAGGDNGPTAASRSRYAIAQEYQMKGDYARAAAEYKRALEGAGDDAGLIHQKIALCYQRLDQRDSAIAHYNDAIRAFKQMKAAGRNVDLADQGIRASEAGIANCK